MRFLKSACLVFLFVATSLASAASEPPQLLGTYGPAVLQKVDGLSVLQVKGTPSEMGRQYGYLMAEEMEKLIADLHAYARKEAKLDEIPTWLLRGVQRTLGRVFWTQLSDYDKEFFRAMKAGAKERKPKTRLNEYDFTFMNSLVDLAAILNRKSGFGVGLTTAIARLAGVEGFQFNCDTFAAWGSRTQGGKTFQTRNTDIDVGTGLEKYPLVVIYKPTGAIPYVGAGFVGVTGVLSGMNASGVAMGQVWAFSERKKLGTPWALQIGEVFRKAHTAAEATELFRSLGKRTYGSNFVFADAQGNGHAIEVNAKDFSVFRDDDPRERQALWNGELYAIPLKEAVFRGDVAMDPELRAHQSAAHGPNGDPRTAGSYLERYKGQADRIVDYEQRGILIGKEEAETISRETAMRKSSLQAAVYANTDRDLWVAYAEMLPDGKIIQAYQGEYRPVPFSLYLSSTQTTSDGQIEVRTENSDSIPRYRQGQNFELRVEREGRLLLSQSVLLDAESGRGLRLPVSVQKGDALTLLDPVSGRIVDRTISP